MHHGLSEFIEFAVGQNVLRFGEFKTKAGRLSPYFFNAGLFNDGDSLEPAGGNSTPRPSAPAAFPSTYCSGPAYKGHSAGRRPRWRWPRGHQPALAFNRKEAKDHGEGGMLVGAPLQGQVLIVDDVSFPPAPVRIGRDHSCAGAALRRRDCAGSHGAGTGACRRCRKSSATTASRGCRRDARRPARFPRRTALTSGTMRRLWPPIAGVDMALRAPGASVAARLSCRCPSTGGKPTILLQRRARQAGLWRHPADGLCQARLSRDQSRSAWL